MREGICGLPYSPPSDLRRGWRPKPNVAVAERVVVGTRYIIAFGHWDKPPPIVITAVVQAAPDR